MASLTHVLCFVILVYAIFPVRQIESTPTDEIDTEAIEPAESVSPRSHNNEENVNNNQANQAGEDVSDDDIADRAQFLYSKHTTKHKLIHADTSDSSHRKILHQQYPSYIQSNYLTSPGYVPYYGQGGNRLQQRTRNMHQHNTMNMGSINQQMINGGAGYYGNGIGGMASYGGMGSMTGLGGMLGGESVITMGDNGQLLLVAPHPHNPSYKQLYYLHPVSKLNIYQARPAPPQALHSLKNYLV